MGRWELVLFRGLKDGCLRRICGDEIVGRVIFFLILTLHRTRQRGGLFAVLALCMHIQHVYGCAWQLFQVRTTLLIGRAVGESRRRERRNMTKIKKKSVVVLSASFALQQLANANVSRDCYEISHAHSTHAYLR